MCAFEMDETVKNNADLPLAYILMYFDRSSKASLMRLRNPLEVWKVL